VDWASIGNAALFGAIGGAIGGAVGGALTSVLRLRETKRRSIVVAIAVAAGIAGANMLNPRLSSRKSRDPMVDEMLDAAPSLRQWIEEQQRAGRTPADVRALAAQLSQRGMRRLDREKLAVRASIMKTMLDQSPDSHACATIARGSSPAAVEAGIRRLSDADRRRMARLSAVAARAELENLPVAIPFDTTATGAALNAIYASLPERDGGRLEIAIADLGKAADDEACWAAKTLYTRTFALPDPGRVALLRAFVEPPPQ
jgi:hypothetical protein